MNCSVMELNNQEKEFIDFVCDEISEQKTISIGRVIKIIRIELEEWVFENPLSYFALQELWKWFYNGGLGEQSYRYTTKTIVNVINKWNPIYEDLEIPDEELAEMTGEK